MADVEEEVEVADWPISTVELFELMLQQLTGLWKGI
jgi:hypothetical protein